MKLKTAFWLTLFAIGICLFHYLGYDHDHAVLYLFSPPTWIVPLFTDIQAFNKYLLYFLTILTWFMIGYFIDRLIQTRRDVK